MTKSATEEAIVRFADSVPDAVFLVNEVGKIQYINTACVDTLGFPRGDIVDQAIMDLVVPADRQRTRAEAAKVLAGASRVGFENRYRHKDGSDVHFSWSASWLEPLRLRIGVARNTTALHARPIAGGELLPPLELLWCLAPYERRVLQLLLTEASEKQIAQRLELAVSTTHSYATGIYRKLGVKGRLGLMSLCIGLLARR